jgi:hypothetical protein
VLTQQRRSFFSTTSQQQELVIDESRVEWLGATRHLVIGGGVVGLAIASSLSSSGGGTVLVEKNKLVGEETSSRNSEVIHGGLYYPPESLKTKLCIRGKQLLYQLLSSKTSAIPYSQIGKWVIAQDEKEHEYLVQLLEKGKRLGIPLEFVPSSDIPKLEPNLRAKEALHSPTTGIIDSHSLMSHLQANLSNNGGDIALNSQGKPTIFFLSLLLTLLLIVLRVLLVLLLLLLPVLVLVFFSHTNDSFSIWQSHLSLQTEGRRLQSHHEIHN